MKNKSGLLVNLIPFNEAPGSQPTGLPDEILGVEGLFARGGSIETKQGGGDGGGGGMGGAVHARAPSGFRRPAPETVQAFQEELRRHGVWASVRVQRGDDQSAACGMLATAAASPRPALSQKKQG